MNCALIVICLNLAIHGNTRVIDQEECLEYGMLCALDGCSYQPIHMIVALGDVGVEANGVPNTGRCAEVKRAGAGRQAFRTTAKLHCLFGVVMYCWVRRV